MANKKTTTKAKTKTVKAAKAVKKTVSKKVVKTAKITKPVVKTTARFSLDRWNLLSAVSFIAFAVLAVIFMRGEHFAVTLNYLTFDQLAAQPPAIVPAARHFFDIQLKWLLATLLVLAALIPILHLTKRKTHYQNYLKGKVLPWRWIEQGVLGVIFVEIIALLAGYQDLATLKLFGAFVFVINIFLWCAEREFVTNTFAAMRFHLLAVYATVATTLLLGLSLLATPVYGQIRASWYVYAAFLAFVLGLILTNINQSRQLRNLPAFKNYEIVERNYLAIGLLTKSALATILIIGLLK